ncbi:unnamed protein product [Symbiodinium sp. CCMP2592]|nr:unnamed protein product [Symbiodinium sp. CCMP2592]
MPPDEMFHRMTMARSDRHVHSSRSPPAMFPTKSSATESTCMDKSALSLSMSTSFSHSEGASDRQIPSEETVCVPRLPQPPEVWVCSRPEEPVTIRRRISGRVVHDEIDSHSVAPSSVSDEAGGKGSRERSARSTKGGMAQDFFHERRLISEPAPAGQIPRPSLSLIESDLEQLYAAARAPHSWNHSCQPGLHDLRNLACRSDQGPASVSALHQCPYCQRLPEIPAEATAPRGPWILPPAVLDEDSRSFSFSEAGQEAKWRSVQPHEGSMPCTVRTSSASHGRFNDRQATHDAERPQHHTCGVRRAEEQSQASFGSRPSSQRSSRTGLREDLAESQELRARGRQAPVQRQSGPSTSRYVESRPVGAETNSTALRAARADEVESNLNPSEQASWDRHSRLPPPPERWLEAQSFAEPGRQLRRLAKRRKALAKELRARLPRKSNLWVGGLQGCTCLQGGLKTAAWLAILASSC